jgi:hypothetical protein
MVSCCAAWWELNWFDFHAERSCLFEHILDGSDVFLAGAVVWVEIVNGVFLKKSLKGELFGNKE